MVGMNNVSSAMNLYASYAQKADDQKANVDKNKNADKTGKSEESQVKLSRKAQDMLDKIKEKYSDMDIFVADFSNDEEAQSILSRGSKEFSVLFSPDELEKMADDEDYAESRMKLIDDAVEQAKTIQEKFSEDEEGNESVVTRVGISINDDGTTTFFAELEKASEKQRERIEEAAERRAEEKKAAEKAAEEENAPGVREAGYTQNTRRVTLKSDSSEDLIKQIQEFDWSAVKQQEAMVGGRFDLSI